MKKSSPDFELALRAAARRQKLRMAAQASKFALPFAAGLTIVGVAFAVWVPQLFADTARAGMLLLAVVLISVLSVPLFRRVTPVQAAKTLDNDLHLPDSALALVQLPESGTWGEAFRAESLGRLSSAVPPTLNAEKKTLILAIILLVTLLAGAWIWIPSTPAVEFTKSTPINLTSLNDVLEDWTAFAEANPNRAGEEVNKAAQALELALKDRETEKSDLFIRIATVEDQLQASMSSAETLQSLLPALAKALAAASNPSQSPSSPPPSASEALDQFATQLPAEFSPDNAGELAELARQLREAGHTELAQALSELAEAPNGKQAQDALSKLSQALSDAEALADAKSMMELAKMQLAAAKNGTSGESEGEISLLPKLSDLGNRGAGAGNDPDFPESTSVRALESAPLLAPLTSSNQSPGQARVQVLPSAEGLQETPQRAPSNSSVAEGPLSEEAITAEALPVVHRATVRKYFEAIRPKTESP